MRGSQPLLVSLVVLSALVSLEVFAAAEKKTGFEDNELLGNPEIQCNSDTIEMQFRTKKMFSGKVYVKGHYTKPECRVDYSRKTADGKPTGGIRLNHGACNMDRQRMISPEGMQFSTVLVISFHPLFITKMDRAFNIKCMYREAVRTVHSELDVSALPTESMALDFPMPTCTYTIRKDELDGPILRYARVGDAVVHRWECQSDIYGVLVHSCYVEDGQGEKQLIVDANGFAEFEKMIACCSCHTDRILLGDPTYVEALNLAYRESFVFKFADRVSVRFQCEIRLCMKEDDGCDGVTPPNCFDENHRHVSEKLRDSDGNGTVSRARRSSKPRTFAPVDADLYSQMVYVLDSEDNVNNSTDAEESEEQLLHTSAKVRALETRSGVCLSSTAFTVLVSALAITFVVASIVVLWVIIGSRKLSLQTVKCTDKSSYFH